MSEAVQHIDTELKDLVADALSAFASEVGTSVNEASSLGTGILSTWVFARKEHPGLIDNAWKFHDALAGKPWPEQCKIIANALGPQLHTAVLMALAYGIYDGWTAYVQFHKMEPVFPVRYWINQFGTNNAAEVIRQEV